MNRLPSPDALLDQEIEVGRVANQDHRVASQTRVELPRALGIGLDDPQRDLLLVREALGDAAADSPTAHDDDATARSGRGPGATLECVEVLSAAEHVDLILDGDVVLAGRNEEAFLARDRDNQHAGGQRLLRERLLGQLAFFGHAQPAQLHAALRERLDLERVLFAHRVDDFLGSQLFGRQHDVEPERALVEVAIAGQARRVLESQDDASRTELAANLAREHVDEVVVGHRNGQVGLGRAAPRQELDLRTVPLDCLDIQRLRQPTDLLGSRVDDRDAMVLTRQDVG